MKKLVLILIIIISVSSSLLSQSIKNPRLGLTVNYGGQKSGILVDHAVLFDFKNHLTVATRVISNYKSIYRIGTGLSYSLLKFNKFKTSIGLEYLYSIEDFVSIEDKMNFSSFQFPIMATYKLNDVISINSGYNIRSTKYDQSNHNLYFAGFICRI